MNIGKTIILVLSASGLLAAPSVHANLVNLSTGASVNRDGIDQNWKVTSISPSSGVPGGFTGNAYVVNNSWPLAPAGPWVANDLLNAPSSQWISYSTPTQVGGDTDRFYNYELRFSSAAQAATISWASDNSSVMTLDGKPVSNGELPNEHSFENWKTIDLLLGAGLHTLDIDVKNWNQGTGNPTGLRVEFAVTPVPEPSTVVAGALLLLPFGISIARGLRRNK